MTEALGNDWPMDADRYVSFMSGKTEAKVAQDFRHILTQLGRASSPTDVPWQREPSDARPVRNADVERFRPDSFTVILGLIFDGNVESADIPFGIFV